MLTSQLDDDVSLSRHQHVWTLKQPIYFPSSTKFKENEVRKEKKRKEKKEKKRKEKKRKKRKEKKERKKRKERKQILPN